MLLDDFTTVDKGKQTSVLVQYLSDTSTFCTSPLEESSTLVPLSWKARGRNKKERANTGSPQKQSFCGVKTPS